MTHQYPVFRVVRARGVWARAWLVLYHSIRHPRTTTFILEKI